MAAPALDASLPHMFSSIMLCGILFVVRIALWSRFYIFIFRFRINSRLWKNSLSDCFESNFLGICMLICFAIFCSSAIRVSSTSLLPLGPLSELVLFVVVIANESLLFLKISRIMLFMVFMALFILWVLSSSPSSSTSWKMWTRYFPSFVAFRPPLAAVCFFPFRLCLLRASSDSPLR